MQNTLWWDVQHCTVQHSVEHSRALCSAVLWYEIFKLLYTLWCSALSCIVQCTYFGGWNFLYCFLLYGAVQCSVQCTIQRGGVVWGGVPCLYVQVYHVCWRCTMCAPFSAVLWGGTHLDRIPASLEHGLRNLTNNIINHIKHALLFTCRIRDVRIELHVNCTVTNPITKNFC